MVEVLKAFKKSQGDQDNAAPVEKADSDSGNRSVNVSRAGWVSPNYAKSRIVSLDMRVVEANRCLGLLADVEEIEHFKLLRTQISQQMEDKGWNTLMVTSVRPGEGKTLTAINLAAMFAREYVKTVILVDADLQKQSIHKYLGYEQEVGLVAHLLENVPMEDIIVWPKIEKLTIISGGRTVKESAELLTSPRMRALLQEMKSRYADRYLFFDVPSLSRSADAFSFAPLVDAILVVVEAGKTPMPEIQKALARLPQEKVLGLVMNRME
ncbi:MAG: polysaccharide biosynthesis tyrosine autokinase [Desulfatitalea sp.]|nr:polysaccharide biosynthesis tyrosine autokinase [Desulfatitalea sp.]NNK02488.1 polysaccharide biosynthesis tyrosine autokinase [Desulfatitalea sp.]